MAVTRQKAAASAMLSKNERSPSDVTTLSRSSGREAGGVLIGARWLRARTARSGRGGGTVDRRPASRSAS